MKKIPVTNLVPGMTCTHHVYFGNNNVLVAAGVPIGEADIQRLIRWGISEVETEGELLMPKEDNKPLSYHLSVNIAELYKDLNLNMEKTSAAFREMLEGLRFVITKIKGSKELDENKIKIIYKILMEELTERKPLVLSQILAKSTHEYIISHSLHTAILSAIIGIYRNYSTDKLYSLVRAALLHNIGMTALPPDLVYREEEMTERDRMLIRTHPLHGYKILKDQLKIDISTANVALMHHERWDGTGYPRGIKKEEIDEFSRIVAVADSYSAMIVDREYRKKFTSYDAMRQIISESGKRFDPEVVSSFVQAMSLYPVGTRVVLNNGTSGIVVESNDVNKLRPVVKLVINEEGMNIAKRNVLIDLREEKKLFIVHVLSDEEDFPIPPQKEG